MIRFAVILAAVAAYVAIESNAFADPVQTTKEVVVTASWECKPARPLAMGGGTVRECKWVVR